MDAATFMPTFSPWRHGGWYVDNLSYANGATGCVSRNYADKKWRIVCDPQPFELQPTFSSRLHAARAEFALAQAEKDALLASGDCHTHDGDVQALDTRPWRGVGFCWRADCTLGTAPDEVHS